MRYYAVIDTNVLVSAMLKWQSTPGIIAAEALTGRIIPLLNDEVIAEYRSVLSRAKFHFPSEAVDVLIEGLSKRGIFIDAGTLEEMLPDPKDVVFYEIVMEAKKQVDAYLITGNIKHFPAKTFVVTPREMLAIMENV